MEYVCGGYFLTKRSGCRVPGTNFVTLSPNHTYFFPDSWAISWVGETDIERFHCATALGIPESTLPSLIARVTSEFDAGTFGWPNVMPTLAATQTMLRLLPWSPEWLLLAFGIAGDDLGGVLAANAPPPTRPGFAPTGAGGIFEVLSRRVPLEPGFDPIGFDALQISFGFVDETIMDYQLPAIGYNGAVTTDGLLPDYEAARTVGALLGTPDRAFTAAIIVSYDPYG